MLVRACQALHVNRPLVFTNRLTHQSIIYTYIHINTYLTPPNCTYRYVPSWCGELDNSWGKQKEWQGCELNDTSVYDPSLNYSLIVPYKQYV